MEPRLFHLRVALGPTVTPDALHGDTERGQVLSMTTELETDYLVIGAGAAGMAFTDALLAHSDGLKQAGELEVTDAEMAHAGAVAFESVTGPVSASDAAAAVETLPGRVTYVLVTWGFLPPLVPQNNEWHDFSGYVAVTDGTIDVVRAIRFEGSTLPADPRPHTDGVAPRTDPRLVRFHSTIGSGIDGLLVRIARPAVEPASFVLRIAGDTHIEAFEARTLLQEVSGGWFIPEGNVDIQSYVARTTRSCYVDTGRLLEAGPLVFYAGTLAIDNIMAKVKRPDGSIEDFAGHANQGDIGPYGVFTGTLGGRNLSGYYTHDLVFEDYMASGRLIGRVDDAGGDIAEMFAGWYSDTFVTDISFFRRAACDEPGAEPSDKF
jgi:hypothetical protein